MDGLALCAGVGGLELGLKLALGDRYRCVAYVEWEAYAAATLMARMEDATLDTAPVWDDLSTFDGRPWHGVVDLISAGYPCQPFSVAGRRAGEQDKRHLWPHIHRIIGEVGPELVFLENVPGHLVLGFDRVLGDLAESGYNAIWMLVAAAGVGAPHKRERLFCLAHARWSGKGERQPFTEFGGSGSSDVGETHSEVADSWSRRRGQGADGSQEGESVASRGDETMGDTPRSRRNDGADTSRSSGALRDEARRPGSRRSGTNLGNTDSAGLEGHDKQRSDLYRELHAWPPGPAERERWAEVLERHPTLEPAIRGMADGLAYRVDRLRCCGNGVVPLVAAIAFRTLMNERWIRE